MAASCTQGNDSALLAVSCPLTLSSQDTVELSLSCSATIFEKKGKFALVICGLNLHCNASFKLSAIRTLAASLFL